MEKPASIKTHLRNMIIVPEMIGSVVGIYNGKTFNQVEIKVRKYTGVSPREGHSPPTYLALWNVVQMCSQSHVLKGNAVCKGLSIEHALCQDVYNGGTGQVVCKP